MLSFYYPLAQTIFFAFKQLHTRNPAQQDIIVSPKFNATVIIKLGIDSLKLFKLIMGSGIKILIVFLIAYLFILTLIYLKYLSLAV